MKKEPTKLRLAFGAVAAATIATAIFGTTMGIANGLKSDTTTKTYFEQGGFLGVCEYSKDKTVVLKDYIGVDIANRPITVPVLQAEIKFLPSYTNGQIIVATPVYDLRAQELRKDVAIHVTNEGCFALKTGGPSSRRYM
jgi:hypothetical protein